MNEQSQLERQLRTRPMTDASYRPVLADLLDLPAHQRPIAGTPHWRGSTAGRRFGLAWVLVLVAIIAALAAVASIGRQRLDLVELTTPPPTVLVPAAAPMFPTAEANLLAEQWRTSWRPAFHDDDVFSGDKVAATVERDGHVWTVWANVPSATSATPARIGAASRIYLVSMVLQLVDEGKLALDTPVSRYVADWPHGDDITVKQLLDGSSGVAPFGEPVEDLARDVAAAPARGWTAGDALRIARARPPRFEPGARHEPADTEDSLLVAVIGAVSHQSFLDTFVMRMQDPLALRTTYADGQDLPHSAGNDELMRGYWDPTGSGTLVLARDLPVGVLAVMGPARGMASTGADLARANVALRNDPAFLSATARELLDRPIESGGVLGSAVCPCHGTTRAGVGVIAHTGPYTTLSVYVPAERLAVVVAANRTVTDADIEGFLQKLHDLAWPAIR